MRRDAALNRTEDLHIKVCKEAARCIIDSACSCGKAAQSTTGNVKNLKVDTGSKQARVIRCARSMPDAVPTETLDTGRLH